MDVPELSGRALTLGIQTTWVPADGETWDQRIPKTSAATDPNGFRQLLLILVVWIEDF